MIVVIFRSRLADEYRGPAERMDELARSMPGYIAHKTFSTPDGAVAEFKSLEAVKAWRQHPEHAEAQRPGRSSFYSEYRIMTCEVFRQNEFKRDE